MVIGKILRRLANVQSGSSLGTKLRWKRMIFFRKFISDISKPRRILDIGGEEIFWERMQFTGDEDNKITLLNLSKVEVHYGNLESVAGDARNLSKFEDGEFDIVFSNSMIEHLSSYEDQKKMAVAVQRIGKRYFIQTPNFYFPFEPHFLFPFFQFFPLWLKVLVVRHFSLGWIEQTRNKEQAKKIVKSIRLLKKQEVRELFPTATICEERMFLFPYSFIIYKGSKSE